MDGHITRPNRTTPLSNTKQVLHEILDGQDLSTGRATDKAIELIAKAANRKEGLTYAGLKQLRTEIGDRIFGKITPEPSTSQPALKQFYAALTDDLEAAVSNSGGQSALRAWQQTNAAAAEVALIRDNVAKIIGIKGDASPHAVLNRITQLAGTSNRPTSSGSAASWRRSPAPILTLWMTSARRSSGGWAAIRHSPPTISVQNAI